MVTKLVTAVGETYKLNNVHCLLSEGSYDMVFPREGSGRPQAKVVMLERKACGSGHIVHNRRNGAKIFSARFSLILISFFLQGD